MMVNDAEIGMMVNDAEIGTMVNDDEIECNGGVIRSEFHSTSRTNNRPRPRG